ncbi:MAG: hypothetical protein ACLR3C_03115 [Eggerthella lenta]
MPHESDGKKRRGIRFGWDNLTYTTRVTAAFAFIAAMTALVAIGVLSFVWEQHFQTYTQANIYKLAESTAEQIAEIYSDTGTLDNVGIATVAGYAAKLNGVGVKIFDNQTGSVVYDSTIPPSENGNDMPGKDYSRGSLAPPPETASWPSPHHHRQCRRRIRPHVGVRLRGAAQSDRRGIP